MPQEHPKPAGGVSFSSIPTTCRSFLHGDDNGTYNVPADHFARGVLILARRSRPQVHIGGASSPQGAAAPTVATRFKTPTSFPCSQGRSTYNPLLRPSSSGRGDHFVVNAASEDFGIISAD